MAQVWTWTVTGPYVPPALQPSYGREGTIEAAKLAFKAKFEAWRLWAEGQGHAAPWHV